MANNQLQPYLGLQEPRIPFIRFEQRPVERRTPEGEITYVDVDFVLITAQGAKDTTEKIVSEWFPQIKAAARDGAYPPGWIPRFEEMYGIWKETKQDPVDGTPVRNWPAISAAECKILLNAGVRSIEDLAHANEEFLGRIGMGARRLKQLAADWVTAHESQAPLIAQLDAMRQSIASKDDQINALMAANNRLVEQLERNVQSNGPQGGWAPPPEERLAALRDRAAPTASDEDLISTVLSEELG